MRRTENDAGEMPLIFHAVLSGDRARRVVRNLGESGQADDARGDAAVVWMHSTRIAVLGDLWMAAKPFERATLGPSASLVACGISWHGIAWALDNPTSTNASTSAATSTVLRYPTIMTSRFILPQMSMPQRYPGVGWFDLIGIKHATQNEVA